MDNQKEKLKKVTTTVILILLVFALVAALVVKGAEDAGWLGSKPKTYERPTPEYPLLFQDDVQVKAWGTAKFSAWFFNKNLILLRNVEIKLVGCDIIEPVLKSPTYDVEERETKRFELEMKLQDAIPGKYNCKIEAVSTFPRFPRTIEESWFKFEVIE